MKEPRPKRPEAVLPSPVEETDLRQLSRYHDICSAVVYLMIRRPDYSMAALTWLQLGQVSLRRFDNPYKRWELQACLDNATDFEHDSAKLLCLPLIGLEWDDLFVHSHQTRLNAWVDHQSCEDFRVPRPGYNPLKEKDTVSCKECKDRHPIVEKYVPPNDPELYRAVAGKRVQIVIGPVYPKED